MKKDIKDYLHLYLGRRCKYTHQEKKGLINIHEGVGMWRMVAIHSTEGKVNLEAKGCIEVVNIKDIKPILRPLSDLGDYEKLERDQFATSKEKPFHYSFAMETVWYLKNGFDLFNLIPDGLAIDKTKMDSSNEDGK